MDWKEKMTEAMKNLQNACNENPNWADCKDCPFRIYCDSMEADWNITPADNDFLEVV
jgi:hypothetical protein